MKLRKLALLTLFAGLLSFRASANPYYLYVLAAQYGMQALQFLGTYTLPVATMAGYGITHTPSCHIFGTEKTTVGLDWSSYAARSRDVYGLQMSLCGGGFSGSLYGIQMSIIACGWVDGYNISRCKMNGLQFAPFAVKTSTANGFQICPFYARAAAVNGFQFGGCFSDGGVVHGMQCGIVNHAHRLNGLQVGLWNAADSGHCLQIGLVNYFARRRCPYMPIVNIGFR